MVELKHPVDADFPNSQWDGCSLGADSDFALLFVAAQFALKVDVTPLEIVPAKSASFPNGDISMPLPPRLPPSDVILPRRFGGEG